VRVPTDEALARASQASPLEDDGFRVLRKRLEEVESTVATAQLDLEMAFPRSTVPMGAGDSLQRRPLAEQRGQERLRGSLAVPLLSRSRTAS